MVTSTGETNVRSDRSGVWRVVLESVFFAVIVLALVALAAWDRGLFDTLMWEDNAAEWATFFGFAFGGVIALFAAGRSMLGKGGGPRGTRRILFVLVMLGLGAFCVFAAGEEISWAQRIFGYMPPELFQKKNFQQEFNFHNVLQYIVSPRLVFVVICFGYGVAVPVAAWVIGERPLSLWGRMVETAAPSVHLVPWFALTGGVYWSCTVKMSPEAAEMMLGLLVLADVAGKTRRFGTGDASGDARRGAVGSLAVLSIAVALGFVANPLIERFVFGVDPQLVQQTREELEAIGRDLSERAAIDRELPTSGELVDSRLYYASRMGWMEFEQHGFFRTLTSDERDTPLGLRQTYFLDPWNNAYWVRMRGYGPVYLYSFGPNRRLDTVLSDDAGPPTPEQLRGDDIGVWIEPNRWR